MEILFVYLAKSSLLLALFYLAYHFLLRKETFFNSNRWFLISGLVTAMFLPLVFIKKIIFIEKPQVPIEEIKTFAQANNSNIHTVSIAQTFNWLQILGILYVIVAAALLLKIALDLVSLYRMINKSHIVKNERFKIINLKQNSSPFSFFNLIVYNAELYTDEELQSIILHEKVHSRELHSMDVLIMKTYCAIFWFNPFIWLYKKAITQNLEYIADQKAIQQLDNKYTYQHALLKVVSNQNCLSITNHFYQSLIKKRIVMLNTNQSNKRKSWKYTVVIPALIAFVLLFQIKIIAQEKGTFLNKQENPAVTHEGASITFDATETDQSLKTIKNVFNEEKIVTEITHIKRNSAGEITGIHIKMKCEDGRKKELNINQSSPIDQIYIYTNRMENGSFDFGAKQITDTDSSALQNNLGRNTSSSKNSDNLKWTTEFKKGYDKTSADSLENNEHWSITSFSTNGKKCLIIVDGEKQDNNSPIIIANDREIDKTMHIFEDEKLKKYGEEGKNGVIIISTKKIIDLDSDKLNGEEGSQIIINGQDTNYAAIKNKSVRKENSKEAKEELDKAKAEVDASKPEMEKAKAEMIKAKVEMIKAKVALRKAKAALDQERADLKKRNNK